ncbi:MAG: flagellar FlbD family protein [Verrucomicrobia bacterium]|nr:flagellar FlbD family protein [Deltaproteobacteria bacterium]
MIFLTRLNKQPFFINPDHIVSIEETPDTVITLFNDHRLIVRESAQVIINKIVLFRSRIIRRAGSAAGRKFPDKPRRRLFQSLKSHADEYCSVESDGKPGKPFHSQDH